MDNSLDSQIRPFPAEEVVTRARQRVNFIYENHNFSLFQVGELWNFDLFKNNSEHFAKWCRYGQEICQQMPYTYNTSESVGAGLGSLTLGPARVHGPSIHAREVNEEEKTEIEFGAQVASAEVGFVKVGVGPTVKAGTRDDTSGLGFTGEIQFAEVSAGPLGVSAGLGISSGFHSNDHGFGAQILGTGFNVCKSENGDSVEKVGVSVLGNKVECLIM